MICGSGGSKSRLAKAAGAEPAGQMRDEKLHAVVARSTFPSQNVQSTSASDHFWKLRCGKSARRCGAKHMSKSKCTKHTIVGPLLEIEMLKKCTPLWREAHFEVKMYKTPHVRATFGRWDVEKVHDVVAWSTFRSQKCKKLEVRSTFGRSDVVLHGRRKDCAPCHKWAKPEGFVAILTTTTTTPHYTPIRYTTTTTTPSLHSNTLHSTTLHCTQLHSITLHYTPQHYNYNYTTTLHYSPLQFTTLHYTTLHSTTTLHYTTLHYTPLHEITLHYTTLHYTTLHSTTLHYATLHYTTLPSTTLHYITLHSTPLHYDYNYDYTTTLHYTPLH